MQKNKKPGFNLACPACREDARIDMRVQPTRWRPTKQKFTCANCETQFALTLEKRSDVGKGQLGIKIQLIGITDKGKAAVLAREAAEKAKSAPPAPTA